MTKTIAIKIQQTNLAVYPPQYTLIPLHRFDATSKTHGSIRRYGKRPLDFNWTVRAYVTRDVLARCIEQNRNVGVRLTAEQLVIDVDVRRGGTEGFESLCLDLGIDPDAWPRVKTGADGFHYYLSKPDDVDVVDTLEAYSGVEFKSKGRQVVAAGSIHPDTLRHYVWEVELDGEPPECPAALLKAITRPARSIEVTGGGQYTQAQAALALGGLEVTKFRNHDAWVRLMMAVHHATNGDARQEWVEWSTSDPEYADQAEIIGRRWDSLHAAKPGGITFRTFNAILAEHGAANLQAAPDVPEDEFPPLDPEDEARLEAAMPIMRLTNVNPDTMDSMFKLVNLSGKMRVLYWGKSPFDPKVRLAQFWSPNELKTALANKVAVQERKKTDEHGNKKTETVETPLAKWWLSKRDRMIYDGVELVPEQDSHADSINLWRGFGVKEDAAHDWNLLREHVRDVIASGDEKSFDYIMRWMAWAVQNPTKPGEVALILKSAAHGTGKGILLRALRKLFGVHGMQISKTGLLTGRFNAHLAMCCLLFVDEMTLGDNKETATLNSTLTEDVLTIEPKGVDAFMLPNHVKVVAASNQEHVVMVANTDRRYAIFEVSDKRVGDQAYFAEIVNQLEAGGYGRMLHDLATMELDGWHPRQDIPNNAEKVAEKINSLPPELIWLAGYLDSGVLDCQVTGRGGAVICASDFYDRARKSVAGLRDWSDFRFATLLKEWEVSRRRSNGNSQWVFPPLAEMRAAWCARFPWWSNFDPDVSDWQDDADTEELEDMDFG